MQVLVRASYQRVREGENESMRERYADMAPGKLEGQPPIAGYVLERIGEMALDDETAGAGEWIALRGRWIFIEDVQGFFSVEKFKTAEKARAVFEIATADRDLEES